MRLENAKGAEQTVDRTDREVSEVLVELLFDPGRDNSFDGRIVEDKPRPATETPQ